MSPSRQWAAPRVFGTSDPTNLFDEPVSIAPAPKRAIKNDYTLSSAAEDPPESSDELYSPPGRRPRSASAVSSNATPSRANTAKDTFLWKLWGLLHDAEYSSLIYWSSKGTHIVIPDETRFVREVCRVKFGQATIQSFNKQMNNWDFKRIKKGSDSSAVDNSIPRTARLWYHVSISRDSSEAAVGAVCRHPDGPSKKTGRRGPKRPSQASRKSRRRASRESSGEEDEYYEEEDVEEELEETVEEKVEETEVVAERAATPVAVVTEHVDAPMAAPSPVASPLREAHSYEDDTQHDYVGEEETIEDYSHGSPVDYPHFGEHFAPASTLARASAGVERYEILPSSLTYPYASSWPNYAPFFEPSQDVYNPFHSPPDTYYRTEAPQPSFNLPSPSPTPPTSPEHHHLSSQFLDSTLLPDPSQHHTSPIQRHPSSYYAAPANPYAYTPYSSYSHPYTVPSSSRPQNPALQLGNSFHFAPEARARREYGVPLSRTGTKGSLADASLGLARSGSLRMMGDLFDPLDRPRGC